MSRIAGILLRAYDGKPNSIIHTMLEAACLNTQWSIHYEAADKASLGWCGWKAPNVAAVNGVLVVMDGCFYNRGDFEQAGNDAGLLASLYEACGFGKALQQLNGDFAVALYDPRIMALWLARDRFGVKPLYYIANSNHFAFASQPGALLPLPGVSGKVDSQYVALYAASHYRYFDNNPENSPYVEIAQLPPAHLLCIKDDQATKAAFWSLGDLPDFTESENKLVEHYRDLLVDAVTLRLNRTARPAFTLSGGMDSSSILASADRASGTRQHAFSTIYEDRTYDESDEIRPMVETVVKEWHPVRIGTPDVFALVRRMIEVHDEPVATATWLSHFILCENVAKKGFGSLFGGLGGDELNAGEYEHFVYHFADLKAAGLEEELAREVKLWIDYHDHPVYRKSVSNLERSLARLVDFGQPGRCLPDYERLRRYAIALNPDFFNLTTFEPVMDHPFSTFLKNRTFQDLFRETIPCCLRAEDRQTTAFGLNHFLPFFDHRLVEFMFRVPGTMKIRNGRNKYLLREAMRAILPEETRTRIKKTGWNAPAHVWFSGPGRTQLLELVHSPEFRERGIYRVPEVIRIIDEHEQIVTSGRQVENHMMFLWQLVNLELWLQRNQVLSANHACCRDS